MKTPYHRSLQIANKIAWRGASITQKYEQHVQERSGLDRQIVPDNIHTFVMEHVNTAGADGQNGCPHNLGWVPAVLVVDLNRVEPIQHGSMVEVCSL